MSTPSSNSSGDLYEELIGETERLLAAARYKVAGYRPWLTL